MLSIVVYGRNDSHGYNLHKRAAISLNTMAELLEDDDDEILFVDYNTPDDLPTFPEAIRDTLTARAQEKIRIIRVRPHHHRPIASLTHLVALEPQSRNIAIRRANPRNRWILSTNPDMVFVPHAPGGSLTQILRDLPDGWYGLPRFELPETYWESFDRLDARGTIDRLRVDARRFHLNEITYGSPTILYDAPGDFQLFLRSDLDAITGFDERMVNGWHVDSNIAKRMQLLRGDIGTVVDGLFGYHCDHTRMASVGHGRDRVENDMRRFIFDVNSPEVAEQVETWGAPKVKFEEFRLPETAAMYASVLGSVLTPMQRFAYEATYTGETYLSLDYEPEHVLPYLLDLLLALPRSARLAWVGTRPRMLELFVRAHRALGFEVAPYIVSPAVSAEFSAQAVADHADVYVFEFGAVRQDSDDAPAAASALDPENMVQLAPVRRLFLELVDLELVRDPSEDPRRFILVNALGNPYEQMVHNAINVNRTPFNTRLTQGFVVRPASASDEVTPRALGVWLQRAMGRLQPVPIVESVRLVTSIRELLDGTADEQRLEHMARNAEPLLTALEWPALQARENAAALAAARAEIQRRRPSSAWARRLAVPVGKSTTPFREAACRIAQIEDWEDPELLDFAKKYFTGAFAASWYRRSRGLWSRLVLLALARSRGLLRRDARVLVLVGGSEMLPDLLTTWVGSVDVLYRKVGPDSDRATTDFLAHPFADPHRIRLIQELPEGRPYDAVFAARNSLSGSDGLSVDGWQAFTRSAQAVQPGGFVALCEDVVISDGVVDGVVGGDNAFSLELRASFLEVAGLRMLPHLRPEVSLATLDCMAWTAEHLLQPHLLFSRSGVLLAPAVWAFDKETSAGSGDVCVLMRAWQVTGGVRR